MRKIDLYKTSDLELLRNLKGNERIFLKIHKTFHPNEIEGIDLKNFSGTIDVSFEDKKLASKITVLVPSKRAISWIFYNTYNAQINLRDSYFSSVSYRIVPNRFSIFSEKDILKSLRSFCCHDEIFLQLERDILLSKETVNALENFSKKINILGNDHKVYAKKDSLQKVLNKETIYIEGIEPVVANEIIFIYSVDDFKKINQCGNGMVVVSLQKDFRNFVHKPISLENFYGSLLFFGNRHTLSDFTISGNDKYLGFFSSIHPTSDLKIFNLNLENVSVRNRAFGVAMGTFLGRRGNVPISARKHFMPGNISFSDCSVKNCRTQNSWLHYGSYVGMGDDAMNFMNCEHQNIIKEDVGLIGLLNYSYFYPFSIKANDMEKGEYKLVLKK